MNQFIRALIDAGHQATDAEQQRIIAHVAQASVSSRLVKINQWLRQELVARGVEVSSDRLPSVQVHLLKRIHFDGQWLPDTTLAQFTADLRQAVTHPDVQMCTYRWFGESFAGFLAPSHVQNVPNPEPLIFVAYSADYGTIKTGFQVSSPDAIFTDAFERLTRHR